MELRLIGHGKEVRFYLSVIPTQFKGKGFGEVTDLINIVKKRLRPFCGICGGARLETGKPVKKLWQSSSGATMLVWARIAEVEVVRSGQIQGIFWRWGQLDLLMDWTWE